MNRMKYDGPSLNTLTERIIGAASEVSNALAQEPRRIVR
jgi:hypothetical protein